MQGFYNNSLILSILQFSHRKQYKSFFRNRKLFSFQFSILFPFFLAKFKSVYVYPDSRNIFCFFSMKLLFCSSIVLFIDGNQHICPSGKQFFNWIIYHPVFLRPTRVKVKTMCRVDYFDSCLMCHNSSNHTTNR